MDAVFVSNEISSRRVERHKGCTICRIAIKRREVYKVAVRLCNSTVHSDSQRILCADFAEKSFDILRLSHHSVSSDIPVGSAAIFRIEGTTDDRIFRRANTKVNRSLGKRRYANLLYTVYGCNIHRVLVNITVRHSAEGYRSDVAFRQTLCEHALGIAATGISDEALHIAVDFISIDLDNNSISNLNSRN